jgi:hypothetical protein
LRRLKVVFVSPFFQVGSFDCFRAFLQRRFVVFGRGCVRVRDFRQTLSEARLLIVAHFGFRRFLDARDFPVTFRKRVVVRCCRFVERCKMF